MAQEKPNLIIFRIPHQEGSEDVAPWATITLVEFDYVNGEVSEDGRPFFPAEDSSYNTMGWDEVIKNEGGSLELSRYHITGDEDGPETIVWEIGEPITRICDDLIECTLAEHPNYNQPTLQ